MYMSSSQKLGKGKRHTGIVVYGNEYYFGGGIQHCSAGSTPYRIPLKVVELGVTHVPKDVFEMYLQEISPRCLDNLASSGEGNQEPHLVKEIKRECEKAKPKKLFLSNSASLLLHTFVAPGTKRGLVRLRLFREHIFISLPFLLFSVFLSSESSMLGDSSNIISVVQDLHLTQPSPKVL
ncbi:hypothetical protein VNO80_17219 [Phaseolus coccineus]|uniref:PPPDE domain-containing protein n=1 Tax=Phaseolus coccineus TaxID=3886 RepID=A0AAN9MTJ4_PHACN